jgi:hypothetical protein
MTDRPHETTPPSDRIDDVPRILEALKEAVRDALLRHKRAGNPVAVWRDGRVVWIAPDDIPVG